MTPQPFTLVGIDIEGEWNRPLLTNAAAVSGCPCVFAIPSDRVSGPGRISSRDHEPLESVLRGFKRVVACETGKSSVSVYDFPSPRERTAVLVGNEEAGIPRRVLKCADAVISIPMAPSGLSSLNVAVAGAISLYALTRDLGRKKRPRSALRPQDVDVLIEATPDPHELGSLLRSVYAFGWRRAFVSDPHRIWFTEDPRVVLESRAAARRAKNLLAVLPVEKLESSAYDAILVCDQTEQGQALSRLRLPECQRLLVVLGSGCAYAVTGTPVTHVTVDFVDRSVPPRARHAGSILLSMIATMLDP